MEFVTIHDKGMLEHALRLAQIAILNPQVKPAEILRANNPDMGSSVHFSPNVVSLEIEGADLPELSLFDLPGSINVHPDESEQHLVGFIDKLIRNFVRDEKALILLTCAVNSDVETSKAFGLIRASKALNRCMGVLTKPDLVTRGRNMQIGRMLNDETFKLGNGWFVTKQLSQEEVDNNVSHSQAREREEAFFDTQDPWNSSLRDFAARFGISNLQDSLSHKLTEHILNE